MPPRTKQSLHDLEMKESILRLNRNMDETKDCLFRLAANFEAHLKQDEGFYEEVKGMAKGMVAISERLGDYNTQLQIHIAGVNELKEQTKMMREDRIQATKIYESRLEAVEKMKVEADVAEKADQKSKGRVQHWIQVITGTVTLGSAIYWVAKIVFGLPI